MFSYVGVTEINAVLVTVDKLFAVNAGRSPFPDDGKPKEVLSFTQEYVVFPSELDVTNSMIEVVSLLHNTRSCKASIVGNGLTRIVKVSGLTSQTIPLFS